MLTYSANLLIEYSRIRVSRFNRRNTQSTRKAADEQKVKVIGMKQARGCEERGHGGKIKIVTDPEWNLAVHQTRGKETRYTTIKKHNRNG